MDNFNSYSSSEQLTALLDGELNGADAGTLFLEMANNPELQTELIHQVSLRNSIQNGLVEPPAYLKAGIIESIGLAETAGVASASVGLMAGIKQLAASKAAAMLGSALLATLLTSALFMINSDMDNGGLAMGTKVEEQAVGQEIALAAHAAGESLDLASALALDDILKISKAYAGDRNSNASAGRNYDGGSFAANAGGGAGAFAGQERAHSHTHPLDSDPLHGTASISDLIVRALAKQPREPAAFRSIVVGDVSYSSNVTGMGQNAKNILSFFEPTDTGLEVQLRGFSGHYFTEIDVPAKSDPVLNNLSMAVLAPIDEHWSVGLEAGQETFNQSYTENSELEILLHEQKYIGGWIAAALQYRTAPVESLKDLRFFVRAAGGGTEQGPIGRMLLGTEYALGDRVSMIGGVEGSTMMYRFQNESHFSSKLALTYGLAFKL